MIETVDIAAIRFEGKVYKGARHADLAIEVWAEHRRFAPLSADGFLTSTDRFVDRQEAAEIAFAAGQTRQRLGFLYSEDIY